MKALSKNFDKSKTYIKNNLSDEEMDEASEIFLKSEKYLTLEQVFKIERERQKDKLVSSKK